VEPLEAQNVLLGAVMAASWVKAMQLVEDMASTRAYAARFFWGDGNLVV